MIIITGATGQLGSAVLRQVLARVPADQVGVSARKAEQIDGVRVRHGDYTDPSTLAYAFEGATRVLIVSANLTGEAAVHAHRNAITAAVAAGAERIVYTSQMGSDPASPFAPMVDHAATEELLAGCGVPFTSMRNGFYAASGAMLLRHAIQTGELAVPEDGPVAWTTHADLAEAAAVALTGGGPDGVTAPLTAADALDMTDLARIAGEVTGRPIRHVTVTDEQYRAALPEQAAEMLLGIFRAARQGAFAKTDPALGDLLGRPPVPFREALAALRA